MIGLDKEMIERFFGNGVTSVETDPPCWYNPDTDDLEQINIWSNNRELTGEELVKMNEVLPF